MRRKFLIGGVILSLALVIGWYVASPYWTLRQVAAAAKANDAQRLSSYVDYPALREDVKAKLTARLIGITADEKDPTASLGRAMGRALVAPMVDALVSPRGLRAAFQRLDMDRQPKGGEGEGGKSAKQPKVERTGLDSFRVGDPDQPGSGLVFKRRGFGWKLAGIDLPPEKGRR